MSTFLENNPSNYKSNYQDLFSELNKFNQFSILEKISESLWSIYEKHSIGDRNINILSLNLIMLTLLDKNFDVSNSKPNISYSDFHKINLMANSVSDIEENDFNKLTIWYIQTHYSQIVLNPQSPFYKIVLFIFLFCPTSEIQTDTLHKYFFEFFNANGEEIGTALWTIFAFFYKNRRLKNLELCNLEDIKPLKKTLDLFSCSLEELRIKFDTSSKYKSGEWKARFNPFRDYPIITEKIDGEIHYWSPSPHFLHLLSTDNLYYFMFHYFFEKEKHRNPTNKDPGKNQFSVDFGKAIEQVVFQFTNYEISLNRKIIPEFKYISKQGSHSDSADIHIVESKSKDLCLVQIKGKRVRLSSQGGNLDSYLKDIDKSLLYGIEQNYLLISQPGFIKSIEEKSSWKFDIKKLTFLIIYVEGFYDISYPRIREYIETQTDKIREKYNIETIVPTAFISLEHYLRLVEWSSSDRIPISDKIRDYNHYLENPSKYGNLGAEGFPHLFDEYIRIKSKDQNYPSSLSKKLYDMNDIISKISHHGIS